MTQLTDQEHLYLFNEVSGAIIDQVGSLDSIIQTSLSYLGDRIGLDGLMSRLTFPQGVINPLASFSYYYEWINKETPTTNFQVLNCNPNGLSPKNDYNGSIDSRKFTFDVNNTEGTRVDINTTETLNNTERVVYACAYDLPAPRLMSFAMGTSRGFRASGTQTEGIGLPVNLEPQFGRGPGVGDFSAYELLEFGTQALNYVVGDLEETVDSLLANGTRRSDYYYLLS